MCTRRLCNKMESLIPLTIEYDPETHKETNGYYGTYLDLYLAEFTENLQWYVDNLDYTKDWTWFDSEGNSMSDDAVASMTAEDKAEAFIEGRYTKTSGDRKGMTGGMPVGMSGDFPDRMGELPEGALPDGAFPGGKLPDDNIVGTPDKGTTQSNTGSGDSSNYTTYNEMLEAYQTDIEEVLAGDKYGNNIVSLYHPLNYIGSESTDEPTWTKIIMGASEGDISMFNSLNLYIAWLNAGVDAEIEWQWDGGHVPSEILGDSFSLYVDQMYGEHVQNSVTITKPEAEKQMTNGTSETASGKDLSNWVNYDNGTVSFSLADAASYRTASACKAVPAFDVIDYGQEDYVFGSSEKDARHWNTYLLDIFEKYEETLESLFNK